MGIMRVPGGVHRCASCRPVQETGRGVDGHAVLRKDTHVTLGSTCPLGEGGLLPEVIRADIPAGHGAPVFYVLGQERDGGSLLRKVLDFAHPLLQKCGLSFGAPPLLSPSCRLSKWGQPHTTL